MIKSGGPVCSHGKRNCLNGSEAVPGETVLVEGPNTIILVICNTYFEARRE